MVRQMVPGVRFEFDSTTAKFSALKVVCAVFAMTPHEISISDKDPDDAFLRVVSSHERESQRGSQMHLAPTRFHMCLDWIDVLNKVVPPFV